MENQETRPEVQSKLSSLLIAPIQRIPRYCLLLQEVLEHTDARDEDYGTLKGKLVELAVRMDVGIKGGSLDGYLIKNPVLL